MGKSPAVIIIARHGARLDAADKQWHLMSPTPYDPPLTYGGWMQSRALGAQISSLLQARGGNASDFGKSNGCTGTAGPAERDADIGHQVKSTRARTRKHKIIIHSSPFLRCVQTAVAVSAGISQFQRNTTHHANSPKHHLTPSGSPLSRPYDPGQSPQPSAILEPDGERRGSTPGKQMTGTGVHKCLLRLDAFLGEWLSPDYFENITPPPGSVMMVAGAKAELLRHGEAIEGGIDTSGSSFFGHFPGGWTRPSAYRSTVDGDVDAAFAQMATIGYALGGKSRSGSFDCTATAGSIPSGGRISKIPEEFGKLHEGYRPPTPTYAISPSSAIPAGYVSHARDACLEVDYQWDSMREPQNWGNGGEYGEEWSSMHDRFQKGLQRMIDWYKTNDLPLEGPSSIKGQNMRGCDDDSTDIVLILITHGAGCNALIGALTGKPVLLDVGVASLTMASQKGIIAESDGVGNGPLLRPHYESAIETEIPDEYEVKLVASTDHLRAGKSPHQLPQLPSPKISPSPISPFRYRFGSIPALANPHDGFALGDSATRKFGTHRMSSTNSRSMSASRSSSGLWGSISTSEGQPESADDIVPNFEDPNPIPPAAKTGELPSQQPLERPQSQHGLWGSAWIPQEREPFTKRRWTMSERHE